MTRNFPVFIQLLIVISLREVQTSKSIESWVPIRRNSDAATAQETGSDQKFLDLQGCGAKEGDFPAEQPVTNFFVQDFQIEQSPCARSIPYIGLKYKVDDVSSPPPVTKLNVSLLVLPAPAVAIEVSELTWDYVRSNSIVLNHTLVDGDLRSYFGDLQYSFPDAHYLALALHNACGELSAYSTGVAVEKCVAGVHSLAYFGPLCREPNKVAKGYGECVENAVQVDEQRPQASCFHFHSVFIVEAENQNICQCRPGYYSAKDNKSCQRCAVDFFKSETGNHECKRCPENSRPSSDNTECFCDAGFFWRKGKVMTAPCVPLNIPTERQYKLESEYTWLNISLERIHPDMNYVMEILKTGEIEHLFASEPLNSNRPNVFIKGLQPNSLFDVYLCDNRDLEFDHGISHVVTPRISRDRRCTKIKEIHTSDEVSVRNLTISLVGSGQSARLLATWQASKKVTNDFSGKFQYYLEIFHNDISIVRTALKSQTTVYEYPVSSIGFYRVSLSLFCRRANIFSLRSEKIAIDNSSEMNEAISTVLIAVVGLILVLLFIVFLLAVIFLRARRDVYPPSSRPAHGVVPPKYVSAMFEYDSQNMTLPYSDKWNTMNYQSAYQNATQGRYLDPEAELLPHFQNQNQTIYDMLAFLGVVSIPYSEIETDKMDAHFTFLKGQIGVSKVKLKNGADPKQQMDIKIPRVDDPEINHALLLEAATLTQLTHNHVAVLHGIVDFGTSEPMVALLLEDCGNVTLLQYIRSTTGTTSHGSGPGLQEKLLHLRCIASALEHFQDVEYVHKVLCAGNVLINPNRVCRIVGFEDRVHFNKAPAEIHMKYVRFWAPEVIKSKAFGFASDMWSFGVLIWQCFNSSNPFQQYTDAQVEKLVMEGHFLPPNPSDTMPPKLCDVMRLCFSYSPSHRPSAYDVKEIIHSIVFSNKGQDLKYDWNSIFSFLSRLGLQQYAALFEMSGFYRIEDIHWEKAEELFKGMGIPKQHRRIIINDAHKTLIENHPISAV